MRLTPCTSRENPSHKEEARDDEIGIEGFLATLLQIVSFDTTTLSFACTT